MLLVLKLAVLGIIQGLTEFLPVSSSGHLGLGELLLGVELQDDEGASVEVALHAGTLIAVLAYVRHDVLRLLRCLVPGASSDHQLDEKRQARQLLRNVAIASVPAAVAGLFFEHQVERLFVHPGLIAWGFLATGVLLLLTTRWRDGHGKAWAMGAAAALLIGVAQVLAMLPGVSRSGATIAAAMMLGTMPIEGARFSFLMAIPVIGGAALLKGGDILNASPPELMALAVGVVMAFASGLLALKLLTRVLRHGRFAAFAWYDIPLAVVTFVLTSGNALVDGNP